jgi:signal transduction histidine kinase
VSDLLDAVRTKPPHLEMVELAAFMQQTLRKCDVPPSVSVRMDIPETLHAIRVDPMQIRQVFWNLINNMGMTNASFFTTISNILERAPLR